MLQVLQKWRVVVKFENSAEVEFYVSDGFYTNVLRKVAEMEWLVVPESIIISRPKYVVNTQIGVMTGLGQAVEDSSSAH